MKSQFLLFLCCIIPFAGCPTGVRPSCDSAQTWDFSPLCVMKGKGPDKILDWSCLVAVFFFSGYFKLPAQVCCPSQHNPVQSQSCLGCVSQAWEASCSFEYLFLSTTTLMKTLLISCVCLSKSDRKPLISLSAAGSQFHLPSASLSGPNLCLWDLDSKVFQHTKGW